MVVAVIPFAILLSLGFSDIVVSRGDIVSQTFSLDHLRAALSDPLYWTTFQRSMSLALSTTALCLLFGYPVAYLFLIGGSLVRRLILVLTIAPLLTSGIVRTYAWLVILGRRGVLNMALLDFGLIDQPLRIMNTHWAVLIGMVQIHLPVMILPLIAVMSRHDRRLEEASANLGACASDAPARHPAAQRPGMGPARARLHAELHDLRGAAASRGRQLSNAATMIYEQVVYSLEWSKGSVTALILMVTCLVVLVAIALVTHRFTALDEGTRRFMSRAELAAIADGRASGCVIASRSFALALLVAPSVIVVIISFDTRAFISFPPEGFTLEWYRRLFEQSVLVEAM